MRNIFIFLLLLSCPIVFGQVQLMQPLDSIGLNFRSNGTAIDSVDAALVEHINLRPGGGDARYYEHQLPLQLQGSIAGLYYKTQRKKVQPLWTGLPYLGFQYAFGSGLNQAMNVNYHHFFTDSTQLHFQFHRRTSDGLLRNSDFTINDVNLLFYHRDKRYSTRFEVFYGADDQGENGGVTNLEDAASLGLEFLSINSRTGRSRARDLAVSWDNYYQFIGDSTWNGGLKTRHHFDLIGRAYESKVDSLSPYQNIFIDSTDTRDQYQTSSLSNGAGIFFSSERLKWDATLNHTYWKNQNLGSYRDTNEAFIHSLATIKLTDAVQLKSKFYFNFLGAIGELKSQSQLHFNWKESIDMMGSVNFMNTYPRPFQRFYRSNYYQWNIENLSMQQSLGINGAIRIGDRQSNHLKFDMNWTTINNGRYFIAGEWRQDTLDVVSIGSGTISGAYHLGSWNIYPRLTLRWNTSNFNYQPFLSSMNRIAYSTKVFSGNLGFTFGVDLGYDSDYQFMEYNGVLGVYSPVQTAENVPGLVRINAFTAIAIDQFRLFVRAENIDYFINDRGAKMGNNYPLMPFILRAGITWDFFN